MVIFIDLAQSNATCGLVDLLGIVGFLLSLLIAVYDLTSRVADSFLERATLVIQSTA